MIRRKHDDRVSTSDGRASDDFHEWVLSLPWVVERPYGLGTRGVRSFGVDCPPLGRNQLWLLTGLHHERGVDDLGLAVIVPVDTVSEIERAGLGHEVTPMPPTRTMVFLHGASLHGRPDVEAVVLNAYGHAMS
jgi:hypothetical protein